MAQIPGTEFQNWQNLPGLVETLFPQMKGKSLIGMGLGSLITGANPSADASPDGGVSPPDAGNPNSIYSPAYGQQGMGFSSSGAVNPYAIKPLSITPTQPVAQTPPAPSKFSDIAFGGPNG